MLCCVAWKLTNLWVFISYGTVLCTKHLHYGAEHCAAAGGIPGHVKECAKTPKRFVRVLNAKALTLRRFTLTLRPFFTTAEIKAGYGMPRAMESFKDAWSRSVLQLRTPTRDCGFLAQKAVYAFRNYI